VVPNLLKKCSWHTLIQTDDYGIGKWLEILLGDLINALPFILIIKIEVIGSAMREPVDALSPDLTVRLKSWKSLRDSQMMCLNQDWPRLLKTQPSPKISRDS
jgi:hypothetical protein